MKSQISLLEEIGRQYLVGENPFNIEYIWQNVFGSRHDFRHPSLHATPALSGIEMACWDIQGKEAGKPVYELLGGAARSLAIRCRFSMGAYPPERARQRAAELVEEGFTTIKVKVGTDLEEDVARVAGVREVIGPDRDLVIDANAGWDAATSIVAMQRMAEDNVGLFEQPTTNGDYHALAEVRRAISCPVMADDIVFDLPDALECIRHEACDVISLYPGKNGGIRKAWEIAELAAEHDVACSIGSNLELDVAAAAMCHLVVACPNMQVETYPGDILGPDYHESSIAIEPLMIKGPVIEITDRPGLGAGAQSFPGSPCHVRPCARTPGAVPSPSQHLTDVAGRRSLMRLANHNHGAPAAVRTGIHRLSVLG